MVPTLISPCSSMVILGLVSHPPPPTTPNPTRNRANANEIKCIQQTNDRHFLIYSRTGANTLWSSIPSSQPHGSSPMGISNSSAGHLCQESQCCKISLCSWKRRTTGPMNMESRSLKKSLSLSKASRLKTLSISWSLHNVLRALSNQQKG